MYNKELDKNLNQISSILEKMSISFRAIAEQYGITGAVKLFDVFRTLGDTFQKVKESSDCLKEALRSNFYELFKNTKKELGELDTLLRQYIRNTKNYINSHKDLESKKEELFLKKDFDGWKIEGCPYPEVIMMNNKTIAFEAMLPTETKYNLELKNICGYYCNKVMEEYGKFCNYIEKSFQDNLINLGKINSNIFEQVSLVINYS